MTKSKQPLRAVVLAAGQGTRMKSGMAKVLHRVLGKTILARVLDAVHGAGVEKAHLVLGHGKDQIEAHLQSSPPEVSYETHLQEPQLGTGHALMQVVDSLAGSGFSGNLIVTVGDAPLLRAETLRALVETHEEENALITVLSTIVDDPKSYGRVVRSKDGKVKAIVEAKDASDEEKKICEVNSAIYCFKWPEAEAGLRQLKNDNVQKEYYLTDLIGWAAAGAGNLSCVVAEHWWEVAGINSRLELAEVTRHLRDHTVRKLALESGVTVVDPESVWIAPEAEIGRDTVVYPGCEITGPVKIGSECQIGPGVTLRGRVELGDRCTVLHSVVLDSILGDDCRVGPFAHVREGNDLAEGVRVGNFVELKKTTVGKKTNVSHLSYVGDAVLGSGANIGAGTITANYDHITKRKCNTTIGDGASTGSNSVLVAPVTVGDGAVVGAGSVITKDVPAGALAVSRAKQVQKEGWADKRKSESAPSIS